MTDSETLLAALTSAGFIVTGRCVGTDMLVTWPRGQGSFYVPTDPAAPAYQSMLDAAIDELADAERRGRRAADVLDRLSREGIVL